MKSRGNVHQHQVIFLKDIEAFEMEYLLQFIYLGDVDIPSPDLERLIAIAKDLGIVGLDAVKKEEHVIDEQRRVLYATKRKATKIPESLLTSKMAKMTEEDPIYDNDTADAHQQDLFDEYLDTHRDVGSEDDSQVVAESDVRFSTQGDYSDLDEMRDQDCATTSWPAQRGGGKKVSPIWNHYRLSDADPKYAQCLHCGKQVSRGSSIPRRMTNSIINYHFRKWHQDIDINEKPPTSEAQNLFISSVKGNIFSH